MTSEGPSALNEPLMPKDQITVSHIYKLRPKDLQELFDDKHLHSTGGVKAPSNSLRKLQQYGFAEGILKKLASEADTGIIGDERDIKRRKQFFGENTKPLANIPPYWDSVKEALDNRILLYLAIAAAFTLLTGLIKDPKTGWIEGVSIMIAIFIIVAITSGNDWVKDKQFVRLQSKVKDEDIAVIRGKFGATQSVNIFELVVGDVIILETGERVPADCVVIDCQDLIVDQTRYYGDAAEHRNTHKQQASEETFQQAPDPFLLSESLVVSGVGRAVVCAVGKNSRRGVEAEKLDTTSKTPLQVKLENMAGTFTKWGIIASGVIMIAGLVNLIFSITADSEWKFFSPKTLDKVAEIATLAIIIVIVAVPEGLPMTITLSLAYSVMRMLDDGILVRNLNSPEEMGGIDEICTGKTATLTKNDMKVHAFYAQNRQIRNSRKNTIFNCELETKVIDLIKESILFNCDARIEMDDYAYYVPVGNGTETGLIRFLQDAEVPVHDIIKRKINNILTVIPFSPIRKRSVVAMLHPDDTVRVYVKGAPEYVISQCNKHFDTQGALTNMADEDLNYVQQDILYTQFTEKGYRAIAFAYKDMTRDEFDRLKSDSNDFTTEEDRRSLERDMTFLSIFALQDDLRDKVLRSVQYAAKGNINVRMVSGDNLRTATAVAIKAGILTKEEAAQDNAVMSGEQFRNLVGELQKERKDDGTVELSIQNKETFARIAPKLRVLGRAIPRDKLLLVLGLQGMGKAVAVTGDGLNDAEALRNANVGFAMGTGCSVAKDASDMILVHDNFEATMKAMMWGRNIYDNVRRFIQFQVTVNFSVLIIEFFGSAILGEPPISGVQLLWVNLIMDTFAAIALAGEKPQPSIIRAPPTKAGELVMTPFVWRQIYGATLWNVIAISMLLVFGKFFYGLDYSRNDEFYDDNGNPTDKCKMYTIVFETFIFLQLFNEFCCRCIEPQKYNMFTNLLASWLFVIVVAATFVMTVFEVQYLGKAFRVTALTSQETAACIIWGSTILLVSILLKLTPESWLPKMPIFMDENKGIDPNDPLMAAYLEQANAKATKFKVQDE